MAEKEKNPFGGLKLAAQKGLTKEMNFQQEVSLEVITHFCASIHFVVNPNCFFSWNCSKVQRVFQLSAFSLSKH